MVDEISGATLDFVLFVCHKLEQYWM